MHSHLHLSSFQHCLLLQKLASNLHSRLHISGHSMCLVSLVLHIRLNTLTFKVFTLSETHSFAYGLSILVQLPLHLLVLILKGKNTGSSPLRLTIVVLLYILDCSLKYNSTNLCLLKSIKMLIL